MTDAADARDHADAPRQATLPAIVPPDEPAEVKALVEALLLVAPESTTAREIADATGLSPDSVEAALSDLAAADDRGWTLVRHGERMQLATAPRFADHVRRFLGLERETRLTGASLETLSVIAYRQPVTRAEIEAVRGVDCSGVITTLISRGLVEAVGRLPALGNPIQYGTSPAFLRHFGLGSLDDLPPLGLVSDHDAAALLDQLVSGANDATSASMPTAGNPANDEPAVTD